MRPRLLSIAASALAASLLAGAAHAEPPAVDTARAAALFDDALAKFGRAEFAEAARAFLATDDVAPSAAALTNAMQAARRAGDYLLVARAAERAIARGDAVVQAREALADAAARLARIELSCSPAPCSITLDGAPTPEPAVWTLPGTHRIEARSPSGAPVEEKLLCVAGATCRAALSPVPSAPEGVAGGPTPPSATRTPTPAEPASRPAPPDAASHHGLPSGVFFTGVAVTAVLAGVTVWSGVDAIAAKNALPAAPMQSQEDDVLSRARRTDFLLLGAGLASVASAVIGIGFTDWRQRSARAAVVPVSGGAALAASLAF